MSGHPQGGHYDDGYGHHQEGNTDSYYQDEYNQGYHDNNGGYADQHNAAHPQGGDGYYDES
jgi:1,3-beta-glucan synthase